MKLKLWKHQQDLVDLAPDKHLLAFECGTGKTFTALELAKDSASTLVICPKSIKEQWEEQTDNKVLTKENFKKSSSTLEKYDCLIIDEAHFFFGMTGARKMSGMLKALGEYINKHDPQKIYLLTATPYMSTPWNIYAAAEILGHKWKSKDFKEHFFDLVNMGMRWPVPVVKKGIEKDIADLVNKIGTTVKMEDCLDLPEMTTTVEYFEPTKEQLKAVKELPEEGIARFTKVHQVLGGTLASDGYSEAREFKSEKIDRVVELANELKKVVICCRYNHEIKILKKILEKNNKVFIINGSVKNRHEIVKMANNEKCIVLVNSMCSEGYQLQTFSYMIFYSYSFSLKDYIQLKGRIARMDNMHPCVYISLVVKNTVDEAVHESMMGKVSFDIAIYDKDI